MAEIAEIPTPDRQTLDRWTEIHGETHPEHNGIVWASGTDGDGSTTYSGKEDCQVCQLLAYLYTVLYPPTPEEVFQKPISSCPQ